MQLKWLQILSNYRTIYFNVFFKILNYFDTIYFFILLFPIIWIVVSRKWCIRIIYLSGINALINFVLKQIFKVDRPSTLDPNLALITIKGFSFPSGAAQASMLLSCLFMYYNKTFLSKVIGISFIFLIGFSRLYLGVHYPTDIIGGWVAGFVIFLCFKKIWQICKKK